jgi:type VI protein secretion system component VasF
MFDDGVRMHEYLLCTILDEVVSTSDPKDRFMECVIV